MCISKRIKWILKKSHREKKKFCIFLQSTHQVDMKNVVECPGEFFAYFNALETTSGYVQNKFLFSFIFSYRQQCLIWSRFPGYPGWYSKILFRFFCHWAGHARMGGLGDNFLLKFGYHSHSGWKHFGDHQCFHLYSPENHTKLLYSFTGHGRPDGISLRFTIQHCPFCAGKMGKFLESWQLFRLGWK